MLKLNEIQENMELAHMKLKITYTFFYTHLDRDKGNCELYIYI